MQTQNLETLKIHKLTKAQYERELEAGNIDERALYLTPDTTTEQLATKADLVHAHTIDDVTDLQSTLDGKAAVTHEHAISDVTGLQTALDGKAAKTEFDSHADDTTLHITSAERTAWNAAKNKNGFGCICDIIDDSKFVEADYPDDIIYLTGSNTTITLDNASKEITIGVTKDNVISALGYTPPTTNTTYTSLKNPYAVTIQANGTSLGTYDGSSAKTFNITPSNIGAYTKAEIDAYSFITTDDIDTICGQTIVNAAEVTF